MDFLFSWPAFDLRLQLQPKQIWFTKSHYFASNALNVDRGRRVYIALNFIALPQILPQFIMDAKGYMLH